MGIKHVTMTITVAVISLWASVVVAFDAQAHTLHVSSSPAGGSTVSDVTEISFTFREPVIPEDTEMAVTTSTGKVVAISSPMTDASALVISATLSNGALPDGKYFASYFIVGTDGMPVESRILFTVSGSPVAPVDPEIPPEEPSQPDQPVVADPAPAEPQPTVVTTPVALPTSSKTTTSTATPHSGSTASPQATSGPPDSTALWLVPVAIVIFAAAATGFVVWRTRAIRPSKNSAE